MSGGRRVLWIVYMSIRLFIDNHGRAGSPRYKRLLRADGVRPGDGPDAVREMTCCATSRAAARILARFGNGRAALASAKMRDFKAGCGAGWHSWPGESASALRSTNRLAGLSWFVMKNFSKFSVLCGFVVLAGVSSAVQAQQGTVDAGRTKAEMCIGCHGISGYKATYPEVYRVPKIGGQNAKYIEAALKAYRGGERKHPSMRGIAGSLSDQDILDVSAYYSAQK